MSPELAPDIAQVFNSIPPGPRAGLLHLRDMIFSVARDTPGVGRVEEALRWGQPAYLTPDTKSGTTLRLGVPKSGGFALFVNCKTTLIEDFRAMAPTGTRFEGQRAVLFAETADIDPAATEWLIRRALTYHLQSRR